MEESKSEENALVSHQRSVHSKCETPVRFVNFTGKQVNIKWINYSGEEVLKAAIMPNNSKNYNTFMTQPWIAVDSETNERMLLNFSETYLPGDPEIWRMNDNQVHVVRAEVIITLPGDDEVVCGIVIGISRANDTGGNKLYVLKLNNNSTEGDPFHLLDSRWRCIWQNDDLIKEGVKTRSIIKVRKFRDKFLYMENTGLRWNSEQLFMDLEFGITVYRSIADFSKDVEIHTQGMSINRKAKTPKVFLVSLKNGVIVNERIEFTTRAGEHVNLKLNCRENLTLNTLPVFLQSKQVTSDEDVGDVAIVRFAVIDQQNPCKVRADCAGLILRYKPLIISINDEPVQLKHYNGQWVDQPTESVLFDTGNRSGTCISKELVEKLELEVDRSKPRTVVGIDSFIKDYSTVPIDVKVRGHCFKVDASVGAVASGTDLLIGTDIINPLLEKNYTLGE